MTLHDRTPAQPAIGGAVFGPHRLHLELGQGATAAVYAASGHPALGPVYALKVLHPHLANDPEVAAMFRDESRLTEAVRGEHLLRALGVGTDPSPHVALPLVVGDSLRALLSAAGGPVQPAFAAAIVIDACTGLTELAATDPTIAHRDICPANLLLDASGRAFVTDLGIAKVTEWTRSAVSRHGTRKGRIAYMASEQLRSEPVGPMSDVFALGAVLWELLMGRPLFRGASVGELAGNVLFAAIPDPSRYRADAPPALDAVIAAALERDPRARIQTPAELAQAVAGACPAADRAALGAWVETLATDRVAALRSLGGPR